MKKINILGKEFIELIPAGAIEKRIEEMAGEINRDYRGKEVIFIGILNGAFLFAASLFKKITLDAHITFVKLASYRGTRSSGEVKELIGWNEDISGKDVIVLEDIVDTGVTLERVIDEIKIRKAGSVKVATLLLKPEACKKDVQVDYVGFKIPNKYVVGYGLDYEGYARNLPSIYKMVE
ncbi:MAG TPA: hypoxanthine phosphoribosyltransferase [Bacteroidales bacterium]|nr:hypoxanthine phosphoribosyltransferase [Bacteroidales bacterium]HOK75050.1 hypoxanthine phosphoribosyltransferase [Bacteroidales bacterium]HOM41342.1 hypoxanthine phosphoribosyltransferase [Bacteroidales bacterium]HOU30203.1 hypoxanthine phosphoribosyltransferase [Bacteroidales bacterium]HPP93097.1 hypoxanthine phosphoribosyltransferase [Bacteroidales bacterium]